MAKRIKPRPILIIIFLLGFVCLGIGCFYIYLSNPVDKNDDKVVKVVIKNGTSVYKIGEILEEKGVIRSNLLFKLYVKMNHINSLKASTYRFKKSMSLNEVIELLQDGKLNNEDALKLIFKPGERITDYAKVISDNTNTDYDSVISSMKDRTYISGFIKDYWFLTDKILDEDIYYPLEGYLAPDTYYFDNEDVSLDEIITRMLKKMDDNLSDYKDIMKDDPHYYLTMASIVQLEGTNTENRKDIVGVFKNRIESGYNLGSDVTTYYALQLDMKQDLNASQFATINPYNTRAANMISKMPIGPICNPSNSSIEASVNPNDNDYLFFVADKNGNIYFTKTNAEHDKKVAEIKEKGDWIF